MDRRIIELYDEYTHAPLPRRAFLDRLAVLAGGTAAATGLLPALENNYARGAIVDPDDTRVVALTDGFSTGMGDVGFYSARPSGASGTLPGVVVIHENRGLNPHIEDVARRYALEGYLAMAVDALSSVGGTPADEDQARALFRGLDMARAVADVQASLTFLAEHPDTSGRNGIVGFCWGGGMVNNVASAPDTTNLHAAVPYYGALPDPSLAANIKVPMLMNHAGLDDRINGGLPAFTAAMDAAGADYTLHIYEGANHAFNNDTNAARYHAEAAQLAWERTTAFFAGKLERLRRLTSQAVGAPFAAPPFLRLTRPGSARLFFGRLGRHLDADMDVAQGTLGNLGRGAHEQVLGPLGHGEGNDLTQVGFVGNQHDNAVDAGSDAAVGRRAIAERVEQAAEAQFDVGAGVARNLEGAHHDIRPMVADGARGKLGAVANDVVLVGEDAEGILGVERVEAALRHGERVVAERDLLLVLVELVEGVIDDPAKPIGARFDEAEFPAQTRARPAGEFGSTRWRIAGKEHRVSVASPDGGADGPDALVFQIACDRTLGFAGGKLDVAEAGPALLPRPVVEFVEEGARLGGGRGRRNRSHHRARIHRACEEAEARPPELLGDVGDDDGVAQVGLVGAVPEQRVSIGNARKGRIGHGPVRQFGESAVKYGFDGGEDVILLDEAHLYV